MALTDDDLREVIEAVWAPSVGLPVLDAPPVDDDAFHHGATLRFTGGWNGHVCIDASDGFARALASVMFGLPESDVTAEDERDSLGEMANVLGGNIKTFAPDEVDLALPETHDPGPRSDVGHAVATVYCAIGDKPVRVSIHED